MRINGTVPTSSALAEVPEGNAVGGTCQVSFVAAALVGRVAAPIGVVSRETAVTSVGIGPAAHFIVSGSLDRQLKFWSRPS